MGLISRRELVLFIGSFIAGILATALGPSKSSAESARLQDCSPTSAHATGIGQQTDLPLEADTILQPGDTIVVKSVNPVCQYYPTNIIVEAGGVYEFDSGGLWKDGWLPPCGPEGWNGLVFQVGNRLGGMRFFLLCGSLGQTDLTAFPIGKHMQWVAPADDSIQDLKLYLFANDWPQRTFRSNNRQVDGSPLRVRIRRVS
jgi:hypothetical protein